jgi:hypothetical protein
MGEMILDSLGMLGKLRFETRVGKVPGLLKSEGDHLLVLLR